VSPAVELAARSTGDGPPLLVLHGLLGQGRNWQAIAKRLAATGRRLHLVDLRNHGGSPRARPTDYGAMAADIEALLDRLGLERASLLGHSMGGKVAMWLALSRPARVDRLVVADVAPVRYAHPAFARYMTAMRGLDLTALGRRSAVEAALEGVDPDPRVRAFLSSNLEVTEAGLRWAPDLDALLADLDAILGFPEGATRLAFAGPTLFLLGARSDYLGPEHEPLVRRLFPRAEIQRIAGAGHWVHADAPEAVVTALDGFLPRA